jgi:ABC-type uncharacterized transport system permease subunit
MDNLDLFDDVNVTLKDVELWLRCVPRLTDDNRENHVRDYILNYDVINKIKSAKRDKSFYSLNHVSNIDNENLSHNLQHLIKSNFVSGCSHIPFSLFKKRGLSLL